MRTASACSYSSASSEREQADRSLPHGKSASAASARRTSKPRTKTRPRSSSSATTRLVLAVADGVGGSAGGPRSVERRRAHVVARADEAARRDAAASARDPRCRRGGEQDGARLGARRRDDARRRAARRDAPAQLPRRRLGAARRRSARAHQAARRAALADGVRRRGRPARRGRSRAARSAPRAVQRHRLVGHARRGRSCAAARGARHGAARERRLVRQPLYRRDRRRDLQRAADGGSRSARRARAGAHAGRGAPISPASQTT